MKSNFLGASGAAAVALTVGMAGTASADQLVYWTNFGGTQLVQGDVTTQTNTVIDTPAPPAGTIGQPDSLVFDNSGNIIGHFAATGIRPQFLQDLLPYGIQLPSGLFDPGRRL